MKGREVMLGKKLRHGFRLLATGLISSALIVACGGSNEEPGAPEPGSGYQIDTIVSEFQHPWGMAFLPFSDRDWLLVTERVGRVSLVDLDSGTVTPLAGVPEVVAQGQGGMLDVALYPDFGSQQEWVYLSYAARGEEPNTSALHVGRGRLDLDRMSLLDFEVLFVATPFSSSTVHFGSRLAFASDWRLYITSGDRGVRDSAQDLGSYWGKVIRLERDGSIPADNPFVEQADALDGIFSYGHRNPQGLAVQPETGLLWQHEHGERNGDEINIIDVPGGNYGWPIATHAAEYGTGIPVGVLPEQRPDTVPPVYFWDDTPYSDGQQGFPPSGMAFYFGDAFPAWRGQLLMGNLAYRYLGRFEIQGRTVSAETRMLQGKGGRVRDVAVHPRTGEIYVLVDAAPGPLLRLSPEEVSGSGLSL